MSNVEELKALITEDVIPDIEDYMDELFALIADNQATADDREALDEMRELKVEFETILKEIAAGEIDEEEALGIIEEIEDMINNEAFDEDDE
jgi:CHASE3 domain sensor protein